MKSENERGKNCCSSAKLVSASPAWVTLDVGACDAVVQDRKTDYNQMATCGLYIARQEGEEEMGHRCTRLSAVYSGVPSPLLPRYLSKQTRPLPPLNGPNLVSDGRSPVQRMSTTVLRCCDPRRSTREVRCTGTSHRSSCYTHLRDGPERDAPGSHRPSDKFTR